VNITADLSSIEPVQRVVDETQAAFGRLDILVNNAGIIRRNDAVDFTEDDWDAVIDTNLKTLFFLSQAAAKGMISQGSGKIINIASMLTFQGGIRVPSYTASKSGVGGLTKAMANEWAAKGINVNAIAPGYFPSKMTAGIAEEFTTKSLADTPMQRRGDADDRAGVALFLGSKASAYLCGSVVTVDGGHSVNSL
jgi:2-deoxy-D-gluconate 3-dehydrogenase